jgi:hypothetical protein
MHTIRLIALCVGLLGASLMTAIPPAHAQGSVMVTVDFAPPPLPIYDQASDPWSRVYLGAGILGLEF